MTTSTFFHSNALKASFTVNPSKRVVVVEVEDYTYRIRLEDNSSSGLLRMWSPNAKRFWPCRRTSTVVVNGKRQYLSNSLVDGRTSLMDTAEGHLKWIFKKHSTIDNAPFKHFKQVFVNQMQTV